MRNFKLIDAVIDLHGIARLVESEIGQGKLSDDIRECADRLHQYSIEEFKAGNVAQEVIRQVKTNGL
jgi:hypothetical protein